MVKWPTGCLRLVWGLLLQSQKPSGIIAHVQYHHLHEGLSPVPVPSRLGNVAHPLSIIYETTSGLFFSRWPAMMYQSLQV